MKYDIEIPNVGKVGHYELDSMPGCPKVGISHGLKIADEYRSRGYGTRAMSDRIRRSKMDGYQVLLCTVVTGNKPQERIMRRYGFREVTFFDNPTTGNRVGVWCKNINDPYDCDFFSPGGCR